MMVELARELKDSKLVQLGQIANITGLSENYLAQLAIPLKKEGLLVGVSGKNGGYHLSRPANKISVFEIVKSVLGHTNLVECVGNPAICLNSSFCEARLIWVIMGESIAKTLKKFTIADMIEKNFGSDLRESNPELALLRPDEVMAEMDEETILGCPVKIKKRRKKTKRNKNQQ